MSQQLSFADHMVPPTPRRRVCDLPLEDQPLNRLADYGAGALATSELLALVVGTAEGPGLADALLTQFGSLHQLARATQARLQQLPGIGQAQAARLLAMLELARRLQAPPIDERPRITTPAMGADLLTPRMAHLDQEELWVILLNTRNRVLGVQPIYRGSLNSNIVRLGEIFRPAIEAPAAALIVAHNHPSGDPAPSPEDITITRQLVDVGALLDVTVLDHLIIAMNGYVSLKERGLGFP